jgi:1,2-diacylglycerol 3-alpha-glucosyltransferase
MRILMISDVYFPRVNGVSTSIRTSRRDLMALGHKVTLIVPAYPTVMASDDNDIVRIPSTHVPLSHEGRMMQRRAINRLVPQLAVRQYDVAHIHTPFVAHYVGVDLARKLGLPTVESYYTFFEEYLRRHIPLVPRGIAKFIARRFTMSQCKAVDRLILPSRAMQMALENYGVRTAFDVLPTGLDANQFATRTRDMFDEGRGATIAEKNESTVAAAVRALIEDAVTWTHVAQLAPLDAAKWSAREMAERLVKIYGKAIAASEDALASPQQSSTRTAT